MDRGTNQVTTRILAFSDLHGNPLPAIRRGEVDLVLVAGDLVPHGDATWESQWLRRYFIPWANRLAPTDIVLVGGNRDHYLSLPQQWPTNVYYLQDSEITLQDLRIYGMPWIERMEGRRPSMFELAPDELQGAYKRIPDGIDILIAHMPPKCPEANLDYDTMRCQHFGSTALYDVIKRVQPKLVICGHVHDGDHRPHQVGKTTVVNVSIINGMRMPVNRPYRTVLDSKA